MSYPRVRPASEQDMLEEEIPEKELPAAVPAELADMRKKRYLGHHSICEKLREVWRVSREIKNEEIQLKAREAFSMAKRMHTKLKWYKDNTEKLEATIADLEARLRPFEEDRS